MKLPNMLTYITYQIIVHLAGCYQTFYCYTTNRSDDCLNSIPIKFLNYIKGSGVKVVNSITEHQFYSPIEHLWYTKLLKFQLFSPKTEVTYRLHHGLSKCLISYTGYTILSLYYLRCFLSKMITIVKQRRIWSRSGCWKPWEKIKHYFSCRERGRGVVVKQGWAPS